MHKELGTIDGSDTSLGLKKYTSNSYMTREDKCQDPPYIDVSHYHGDVLILTTKPHARWIDTACWVC